MDKRLVLIFLATSSVFLLSGCPNTDDAPVSGKNVEVEFTVTENKEFGIFDVKKEFTLITYHWGDGPHNGDGDIMSRIPWTKKIKSGTKRPVDFRLVANVWREGIEKIDVPFTLNIKVDGKVVTPESYDECFTGSFHCTGASYTLTE